jgi:hypothetical protein
MLDLRLPSDSPTKPTDYPQSPHRPAQLDRQAEILAHRAAELRELAR